MSYSLSNVSFYKDGKKIEPENGTVTVEATVKQPDVLENADPESLEVHHINEQGSVEAQKVASSSEGNVEVSEDAIKTTFDVESFSTFVITFNSYSGYPFKLNITSIKDDSDDPKELAIIVKNVDDSSISLGNNTGYYDLVEIINNKYKTSDTTRPIIEASIGDKWHEVTRVRKTQSYWYLYNNKTQIAQYSTSQNNTVDLRLTYPKSSHNLYCYVLVPGESGIETYTSGFPHMWYYMGLGKIQAPDPNLFPKETATSLEKVIANGYTVTDPEVTQTINYMGKDYKYADENTPEAQKEGYYTITWQRVIVSEGANHWNHNGKMQTENGKPKKDTQGNVIYGQAGADLTSDICYHLDGIININTADKINVNWLVKYPNSSEFTLEQSVNTTGSTIYSALQKEPVPQPIQNYTFDGWYRDEKCTDKLNDSEKADTVANLAGKPNGVQNHLLQLYARYIPSTVELSITNEVYGNLGDRTHPFEYELVFLDSNDTPISSESILNLPEGIVFSGGTYRFTLTHGQSTPPLKVPSNLKYKVTQTDGKDHETKAFNDRNGGEYNKDTQSHTHDLSQNTKVTFNNTKQGSIPSGLNDLNNHLPGFVFAAGAGLLLLGAFIALRRRTNES